MSNPTEPIVSRAKVRNSHALIPSKGVPPAKMPRWRETESRVLACPAMGAGFVAMLLNVKAGGGVHQSGDDRTQTFFYMLGGGADCTIAEHRVTIGPGGFAYVPHAADYEMRAPVDVSMLLIRKRYEPQSGVLKPEPLLGNQSNIAPEPLMGNEHARVKALLPDDLSNDFAMNILSFDPGHGLPQVQTHVAQHGVYLLEGSGTCYLGEESLEVQPEDFIWTGPFCPHGFTATGQSPARMICFKNLNRDVSL
jgi:(S)-ureidoglycine aminohydrolase